MHQVPFKALLWPLAITLALLFGTGIFAIKKPTYSCIGGKTIHFDKKVEVITLGTFHVYAYPIRHDCDEKDRYDPLKFKPCGDKAWCTIEP